MKFKVTRSSILADKKPCEEAFRYTWPNRYTPNGPDELLWTIEIEDLIELISFVNKYSKVVLSEDTIEIYDTYRE